MTDVATAGVDADVAAADTLGLEAAEAAVGTIVEYRVMQTPLFKKPGSDPAAQKVIKLTNKKVGAKIKTTGNTWVGPSGGEWVELDSASEKLGWVLVEGPGFNQPGPHLQKVAPGEEESMVLYALSPLDDSKLCDMCVKPSQTIGSAKTWVALKCPGLVMSKIQVAREKPSEKTHGMGLRNFPASWMFTDAQKISETPFQDGGEFVFLYLGSAEDDIAEAKANAEAR